MINSFREIYHKRRCKRGCGSVQKKGLFMDKERLEWVLSGLNRYKLNQKEDQFVKSTEYDFNQKDMITE